MKATRTVLAALLVAAASAGWAQNPAHPGGMKMRGPSLETALADEFFMPDLVRQHHEEIGLTEEQKTKLQDALQSVTAAYEELQGRQQAATEKVVALAKQDPIDETKALAALDALLKIEGDLKRMQARMLILIRNTLTPEQRAKLREIKGGAATAAK